MDSGIPATTKQEKYGTSNARGCLLGSRVATGDCLAANTCTVNRTRPFFLLAWHVQHFLKCSEAKEERGYEFAH